MTQTTGVSFGIATAPMQVDYPDIVRVWREADGIPLIEQGAIIGAIGCSGGTDSQDETVSKAGAAVINQPPGRNK